MNSIGNDIIALKHIDVARTNTPRFYTKFLADSEQHLYQSGFTNIPFHYFAWLLWSVKEAAYKCLQRQQPHLVFSPVNTVIVDLIAPKIHTTQTSNCITEKGFNDDTCFSLTIRFNSQTLHARSVIYGDELIYTVAAPDLDFSIISWGLKQIADTTPANQSAAVRAFLLENLKLKFPSNKLSIEKNASGAPIVLIDGIEMPVSLSHHGNWVGYAYMINSF
jgi:phosphopantetheinyl transferase (holo-ACP synthase)